MARRRRDEIRPPERTEQFPAFVMAALGVGLAGQWPGSARRRGRWMALAVPFLATLAIGAGPGAGSPGGLVARGRAAYDSGRFAEALEAFERAIVLDPAAAIPRYDSAATLFQLHRYSEAIARYEQARERGDPGLATKIDYALGNAHLALGRIPEALAHYDACIASTWPGPAFDAVRRDAAENRVFAASRTPPPPDEPGDGSPRANRPDRPRAPQRGGPGSPGDSPASPSGADPSESGREGGPSSSPSPRAGRSGDQREGQRARESPEARLDSALREIHEARRRRPAESTPMPSSGRGKDW
jgi:tetratricopeptide (TPR) repeat protein